MERKLLAQFALKWDPFAQEVPLEGIYVSKKVEYFLWRVVEGLIREGGFALLTGDNGNGKSVVLRLLEDRLRRMGDVAVGTLSRPSSGVPDIYRELGELFGVELKPHNRWFGFKALRERWQTHIESTLIRPVLLIDEAQDLTPVVLSELRLLTSTRLDSRVILTVVLAADSRIVEKLRHPDLAPLASRVRARLPLERLTPDELLVHLKHLIASAGNARLMTPELMNTICEHSLGNLRTMTLLSADLLAAAARSDRAELDEKLYLETFDPIRANKAVGPKGRGRAAEGGR